MKRWLWRPWLILLVVLSMGGLVLAGFESISVEPNPPIVVGNWYTYNADEDYSGWADGYDWDYQCTEGGGGDWTPDPPDWTSGGSIVYPEPYVGGYNIRVRAYFHTGEDPPEGYEDEEIRAITVVGPDNDNHITNTGVDSSGWPIMEVTIYFHPRYGAISMGGEVAARVEERIQRGTFDSGWMGESEDFGLDEDGVINDNKKVNGENPVLNWESIPVNGTFDDFYQTNRIIIKNCNDVDVVFTFATHRFWRVKTGDTTYKLVQVAS